MFSCISFAEDVTLNITDPVFMESSIGCSSKCLSKEYNFCRKIDENDGYCCDPLSTEDKCSSDDYYRYCSSSFSNDV
jgi:hypothetical protein